MLLSFLQNNCDFKFDGKNATIRFKEKMIVEGKLKSPGVYKIIYEDKELIDISVIN